jgi:hypothetical protein
VRSLPETNAVLAISTSPERNSARASSHPIAWQRPSA